MTQRLKSHFVTAFLSMEEIVQEYLKICRFVLIEGILSASEVMRSRFEPALTRLSMLADYCRQCVKSPRIVPASWLLKKAKERLHVLQRHNNNPTRMKAEHKYAKAPYVFPRLRLKGCIFST